MLAAFVMYISQLAENKAPQRAIHPDKQNVQVSTFCIISGKSLYTAVTFANKPLGVVKSITQQ